jgi:glutaminase
MDQVTTPFTHRLQKLHAELGPIDSGELAGYIPELRRADPASFGLAITTVTGEHHAAGATRTDFSIQSVSKPFVYAMALMDLGEEEVLTNVGIEPTGDPFNAVTLSEQTGRPLNPMVNAGAIVTSSLVKGDNAEERTARILSGLGQFAGRELTIDRQVESSENATSDRNRAISYLMRGAGSLHLDVEDALSSYIAQCSVLITASDLAVMAATLAGGGRNPVTDQQVVPPELITRVLTIMSTCGMYDGAGEWMYRVGLPAKSGVSGAIMSVLPNQLGLAAWSPPLDMHGNSVRGVLAMENLSRDLDLHVYFPTGPPQSPIRRITTSQVLRARTGRTVREQKLLTEHGSAARIVELQGAITLVAAQDIVHALRDAEHEDDTGWLVLDHRQVAYIHPGALKLLDEALKTLADSGVSIQIVQSARKGARRDEAHWHHQVLTNQDLALQQVEDAIIAQYSGASPDPDVTVPLTECQILAGLSPNQLAKVQRHLVLSSHPPGSIVKEADVKADGVFWILSGEVDLLITVAGLANSTRLRGIGPGGSFGELVMVDRSFERGLVVATQPTRLVQLSLASWNELTKTESEIVNTMLRALAVVLADRQRRLLELLESMAAPGL